jgi:hypothetical protein
MAMTNPRLILLALMILSLATASARADDLYRVAINSHEQAAALAATAADPLLVHGEGYLVLTDAATADGLQLLGVPVQWLAGGIERSDLILDTRVRPDQSLQRHRAVFSEDAITVYRADDIPLALAEQVSGLISLSDWPPAVVVYKEPMHVHAGASGIAGLDTVVTRVSQDSLESYVETLQAFGPRVAGTAANYAARDYIYDAFVSFGFDSVYLDEFTAFQLGGSSVPGYNVVAVKTGTAFPDKHVVVGGHFDAVPGSPGADDNGSGTAGTMEIARVIAETETAMTFVFIAFDSEESGLWGARHYAQNARLRGDDIVVMLNMDMIAYYQNDTEANLFYGPLQAYAILWDDLAGPWAGINGFLAGSASNSDHAPFVQSGYDAVFVHERIFSNLYHSFRDSTTYMNFDYMTRMVKATLATGYTVSQAPPPVSIVSLRDAGDGQSILVAWEALDQTTINDYVVYYTDDPDLIVLDSIVMPPSHNEYLVTGLSEGIPYTFFVSARDEQGTTSYAVRPRSATPNSIPPGPKAVTAMPVKNGIRLSWSFGELPLDFDRFGIFRDGLELSVQITDTVFIDNDPMLGTGFHEYLVVAIDNGGNASDTAAVVPVVSRAATLEQGRILAINRTAGGSVPLTLVDDSITAAFLQEALAPYNYDFRADTNALMMSPPDTLRLWDLLDYQVVVVGVEAARFDELTAAGVPVLDQMGYYHSIGGRVVIFGRWGELLPTHRKQIYTYSGDVRYPYYSVFGILQRFSTPDTLDLHAESSISDLIGATSLVPGYPQLVWDSSVAVAHGSDDAFPVTSMSGIPGGSYVDLVSGYEVVYTYDSRRDDSVNQGQPVAWRHNNDSAGFVFFDLPLSAMERTSAVAALRKAIDDLTDVATDVPEGPGDIARPNTYWLAPNYPNPFNPTTTIRFYLPRAGDVTLTVFNMLGQKVKVLKDQHLESGEHVVRWNGINSAGERVASGVYFYRLDTEGFSSSRKMMLLK